MPAEPDLLRPHHRLRPALAGSTSYAPTSYATTERTFGLRTTVAAYPSGDGSASGSSAAPHRIAGIENDSNQLAFYQRQRYDINGARWSDMNPQMSAVGDGAAFVRLLEKGDNHRQAERTRIDRMESERSQIAREREQWQLEARSRVSFRETAPTVAARCSRPPSASSMTGSDRYTVHSRWQLPKGGTTNATVDDGGVGTRSALLQASQNASLARETVTITERLKKQMQQQLAASATTHEEEFSKAVLGNFLHSQADSLMPGATDFGPWWAAICKMLREQHQQHAAVSLCHYIAFTRRLRLIGQGSGTRLQLIGSPTESRAGGDRMAFSDLHHTNMNHLDLDARAVHQAKRVEMARNIVDREGIMRSSSFAQRQMRHRY